MAKVRKSKGGAGRKGDGSGHEPSRNEEAAPLHAIAESRYLNYALSVITSRALPDVRDGLKPVQRRILYTMWQGNIGPDAKFRKCAKVVGDVMGNYHPHGDAAIYDALVRMAQSFSLRVPLVDGSGNFGSLDGDPAAAYRYTECRLARAAEPMLAELDADTVPFRPSYDGTKTEPVVLPARLPNLLVNGASGIAVGMATSIPPHNPEEVTSAAIRLLDALTEGKELSSRELCRTIKGPDFPTGGQIVSSAEELKQLYETGQGSIKVRGTWEKGPEGRTSKQIIITSIPYAVNKSTLVERIAEVVTSRKMPLLLDVRDVSTDDVRIELELKRDADEHKVLAYLYKQTPLQSNVAVNLVCLVPTENPEVGRPERLDLRSILWHFLRFRLEVVTRRLQHELGALERRMHILEGFVTIFDALDAILKLIRASEGKADAAKKIMAKYALDAEQTDAILELRLYRLARLEILVIQEELKAKQKRAKEIRKLLGESEGRGRWAIVRSELDELVKSAGAAGKRRTVIESVEDEPEFSAEELIVAEDNHVLLTRDGWVKRQKEIKDPSTTRLRDGDQVLSVVAGSTRATVAFFSSFGTAYTCRIIDIPATTGYGEPIQKLFKLKDGERILTAVSLDPRVVGDLTEKEGYFPESYLVAASSDGYALAFGLGAFLEPSTKSGRRYARPSKGAVMVGVERIHGDETLIAASKERRALLTPVEEVSYLSGPGKGVLLLKLAAGDELLGIKVAASERDTLIVRSSLGGDKRINTAIYETSGRGGRGREIMQRGKLVEIVLEPPAAPPSLEETPA
ncbi:MAG: DNA topoisomerase 4 subunit A [Sorangiineae bacterium]|nr:DNA topoisomerase 4 subunit A [Polyangiaceae bacterium]MEB2321261.1 DNA topoisomerase 4 subunit A [Sorangiineae bacterium]